MTTETDLYRLSPDKLLERAEKGDILPQKAWTHGCLSCAHHRSSLDGWPCRRQSMPSARIGRCACWEEGDE